MLWKKSLQIQKFFLITALFLVVAILSGCSGHRAMLRKFPLEGTYLQARSVFNNMYYSYAINKNMLSAESQAKFMEVITPTKKVLDAWWVAVKANNATTAWEKEQAWMDLKKDIMAMLLAYAIEIEEVP